MEAISALSGGALLSRLHNYTRHGDVKLSSFSLSIMQSVCAPVYHMIARWILYGELQDPYHEFFIGLRSGVNSARHGKSNNEHMWNDVYYIRLNMLPCFIPLTLAKQIFLIGKSINFLRQCKLKLIADPSKYTSVDAGGKKIAPKQSTRTHNRTSSSGRKQKQNRNRKIQYSFGRKVINTSGMALVLLVL